MYNPFAELVDEDAEDVQLVRLAVEGSRDALERLILRHQAWIYNIALRMVFQPADAEEVTQEVLIKALTKLSTFQAESQFRTWLYRITANHVLNMRRRGAERQQLSFSDYGSAINRTPDLELPDPGSVPVDVPLLVEEAKIGCTMGMLLCLDRRQRLVFILGEILAATDKVGAEVLEITPDNFRQSLARARRDLSQFMHGQCGLVNPANPCRCAKKTRGFIADGHVDPERLLFAADRYQRVQDAAVATARQIEDVVVARQAEVFREHPFQQPPGETEWLRRMLEDRQVRAALHLN